MIVSRLTFDGVRPSSFRKTASISFKDRRRWRIEGKPGTKLEPRERPSSDEERMVETVLPKVMESRRLLREKEPVGIKEVLKPIDLGYDEEELKILEGPLSGNFRCFSFHEEIEFFIAENAQGQFDLCESYLFDKEARLFVRPIVENAVPCGYRNYQIIPWDTFISGDAIGEEEQEESFELHKVFIIGQLPIKEGHTYAEVDFNELYCIDASKRTISKPEILDFTDEYTVDPVLCIKQGDIAIQDSRDCPTMEGYAQAEDLIEYIDFQLSAKRDLADLDAELLEETDDPIDIEDSDIPDSDNL